MAAVPFVANLVFMNSRGVKFNRICTVSDVNAAAWVWEDAGTSGNLRADLGNLSLIDIILGPAGGTDTRTSTIRINGQVVNTTVLNSANLGNVIGRQFQQTPLSLPAGAQLQFLQVT